MLQHRVVHSKTLIFLIEKLYTEGKFQSLYLLSLLNSIKTSRSGFQLFFPHFYFVLSLSTSFRRLFTIINLVVGGKMAKPNNSKKLDSTSEEEEEPFEFEDTPVDNNTIGRPNWWFNGSSFIPQTNQDQRLASLQYQTLVRSNPILSERAQRIRRYISTLSQWFPLPVLDEIGKEILLETNIRQNDKELLAHLLGALEATLRQKYCTIHWSVLQEINQTTEQQLQKKDLYKWMFYTRQRKKDRISDTLRVVQRLTIEAILGETIPAEYKRQLCLKVVQTIKMLRLKGFICKDPEVASWALKRILLEEKGPQTSIPKELRPITTRMTFRLRQKLKDT